jgi:hypothetical protein
VTVLVACETIVLALLVVLVAALLRSHAEILRRLGPPDEARSDPPGPLPEPPAVVTAHAPGDLVGTTLDGDAVKVSLGRTAPATLIAFLTSGCAVCGNFWDDLRRGRPPELGDDRDLRLLVVTKDSSHESPSRLTDLRPDDVPVIMSTAAWRAHRVPAAPYFVFVDGGLVHGEGSATTWKQIASLMRDAEHDARHASATASANGNDRTDRIDEVLQESGIVPGHPSLYPAGQPGAEDRPE